MVKRQQKPAGVVVIAILQIVFGGLGLLGPVLYFAGVQKAMASWQASMPKAPNQPVFSQEKMQAEIEQRIPGYTPYMNAMNAFILVLCALMIAGGIGLLQLRPWGRWVTILYAALSMAYTIGNSVFMLVWFVPAMSDVMTEQFKLLKPAGPGPAPDPAVMGNFMQIVLTASVVFGLLLMIYPIIVLVIMLLPSTRAAFRGPPPGTEHEDYRDPDWGGGREATGEGGYRTKD